MITELIITMFISIANFFINWFPAVTIPTDLLNSMAGLVELFAVVSFFMPIGILQIAIGVFLAFHAFEFIVSIVNWLIAKIPTIE